MNAFTRLLPFTLAALMGLGLLLPSAVSADDGDPAPRAEREAKDWVAELSEAERAELARRGIDLDKLDADRRQRLARTLVKLREKLRDPEAAEKLKARLQMLASQGKDGKKRLKGWERHLRIARAAARLLAVRHLSKADRKRFNALSKERQMASHWALHRSIRAGMSKQQMATLDSVDPSILHERERNRFDQVRQQLADGKVHGAELDTRQRERLQRGLAYMVMSARMRLLMQELGKQDLSRHSENEQAELLVAAVEKRWPGAVEGAMEEFKQRFADSAVFDAWLEKTGSPPSFGRNPEDIRRFTVRDTAMKMLRAVAVLHDLKNPESLDLAKRLVALSKELLQKRGGRIDPAYFTELDAVDWNDRKAVWTFLRRWETKIAPRWRGSRMGPGGASQGMGRRGPGNRAGARGPRGRGGAGRGGADRPGNEANDKDK